MRGVIYVIFVWVLFSQFGFAASGGSSDCKGAIDYGLKEFEIASIVKKLSSEDFDHYCREFERSTSRSRDEKIKLITGNFYSGTRNSSGIDNAIEAYVCSKGKLDPRRKVQYSKTFAKIYNPDLERVFKECKEVTSKGKIRYDWVVSSDGKFFSFEIESTGAPDFELNKPVIYGGNCTGTLSDWTGGLFSAGTMLEMECERKKVSVACPDGSPKYEKFLMSLRSEWNELDVIGPITLEKTHCALTDRAYSWRDKGMSTQQVITSADCERVVGRGWNQWEKCRADLENEFVAIEEGHSHIRYNNIKKIATPGEDMRIPNGNGAGHKYELREFGKEIVWHGGGYCNPKPGHPEYVAENLTRVLSCELGDGVPYAEP